MLPSPPLFEDRSSLFCVVKKKLKHAGIISTVPEAILPTTYLFLTCVKVSQLHGCPA